jgi:psiF repeat-containing protein
MRRHAFVSAILIAMPAALPLAMVPSAPSFALSAKDKMATCKFGADDQKLDGAARSAFMKKCMSDHNDPRGPGAGGPAAAAAPPPKQ